MENDDLQYMGKIMSALTHANKTIENLLKENSRLQAELSKRKDMMKDKPVIKVSRYLENVRLADKANEN